MAHGHDSTKTPPPPPPPPPPKAPDGPGSGIKPKDVYQPPQISKMLPLAGFGAANGRFFSALLGCCLHQMN